MRKICKIIVTRLIGVLKIRLKATKNPQPYGCGLCFSSNRLANYSQVNGSKATQRARLIATVSWR